MEGDGADEQWSRQGFRMVFATLSDYLPDRVTSETNPVFNPDVPLFPQIFHRKTTERWNALSVGTRSR